MAVPQPHGSHTTGEEILHVSKKGKKKARPNALESQDWTHPAFMLGIDLGGTKILAAVVDHEGRIIGTAKRKTRSERGVDEVIERIARTARDAVADAHLELTQIRAVGIGAPGVADYSAGVVSSPNLKRVNVARPAPSRTCWIRCSSNVTPGRT